MCGPTASLLQGKGVRHARVMLCCKGRAWKRRRRWEFKGHREVAALDFFVVCVLLCACVLLLFSACVYVCGYVYVFVCIYMWVCMYAYVCVCMYV